MGKEIKLVKLGVDTVVFEDGYWMDRKDYDFSNAEDEYGIPMNRNRIGWDVNEVTKKLTYFFLPINP